jgi:TP901 family phage tail tape measure protein
MPGKNETTTKFNVDISELKKGITEANRQIKLANAQFKAASAGMDDWSKSTDGLNAKIKQTDTVLQNQKTVLSSYEKQLELIVAEYGENSSQADNMRIKVENQRAAVITTEKSLNEYKTALTELRTAQGNATKSAEEQGSAYDGLKTKINNQESELNELKQKYASVVIEQGKGSTAAEELAGEISQLSSELQSNKNKLRDAETAANGFDNSLENVSDEANKTTNGGLSAFSIALGNLIADVVANAINKLKDLAVQTMEVGKAFDGQMSKVGAISGATAEDMEKLRAKAKEMGSTTKFTATEAAQGFEYMAMAGWKTEDMLDGIDGVLNLAAASGSDLGTTSDIVTDALTAMGYSAKDAGRLADVMAAASSNANTNVEMMGQTFQYAAPIVGAMGYNMEDTAEQIGLMANAGIKGEKAGTALRSILSRLAAPPKQAAEAMDALGISLTDSQGNMKSLDEVMADLRKAFSGLSETQQTQYAKQLAGQQAMSGLLAIVNAAPADVDKLSGAIANADGAAEKMANTMLDNLGGDMTLLSSKMEGVQLAIYEKFEPALRAGVGVLDRLLDGVQYVVDHSTEFIAVLGGMATAVAVYVGYTTALTVMTKGWQALTIATKAQAAAQKILNFVMSMNPIGLIIAAIAALVAAFVILWNKSDAFRNFWIGLWEKIKTTAQPVVESLAEWFSAAWEKIKVVWGVVSTFFVNLFTKLWENVKPLIDAVVGAFIAGWELLKVVWGLVLPYFQGIWDGIKTIFSVVAPIIGGYFKSAWAMIQGYWSVAVAFFKLVWTGIQAVFSVVKAYIGGAFKTAWEYIKLVWSVVGGYFKAVWNTIKGVFSVVKAVLTGNWKDAWEGIKGIVKTWASYFGGIWAQIKRVFSAVSSWFTGTFGAAWDGIKKVFSGVGEFFSSVWATIKKTFKKVGTAMADAISGSVKAAVNGILRTAARIINGFIKAINGAIGIINKIPGVEIKKIKELEAPQLAQGGVLKRGQVGILEGNGAEAVVPLERNKAWISKTAQDLRGALEGEGIIGGKAKSGANVTNYTFNQTNNSPKALSRLEIYRQTQNQLKFAKGV